MSVKEIQAALKELSPLELQQVEQSLLVELRKTDAGQDDYAYGMKEYGLSREELQAFEKKQDAENREMDKRGETVTFHGPFDPASLD
jgi:hypothetical protein